MPYYRWQAAILPLDHERVDMDCARRESICMGLPVAIELEARDAPMIDGVAIPQEGLTQTQDEVQVEIGTSMTELLQQAMQVRTGSQELVYDRVTRTGDGNGPSHA